MTKPNCYKCKHRGRVVGSAHSSCNHPLTRQAHNDHLSSMMAIFASAGRSSPQIGEAAIELGVTAKLHGIAKGWFNWPWNFDPVWLMTCNGFEAKEPK